MQIIPAITLFSALASTGFASFDVYSYFVDAQGSKIHNRDFIIGSKKECINATNTAVGVGFSQWGRKKSAEGAYCAKSYDKPGCNDADLNGTQLYYDVPLDNGKILKLGAVTGGPFISWNVGYCPDAIDGSK